MMLVSQGLDVADLLSAIARRGSTLRFLRLYCPEVYDQPGKRPILTIQQLEELRASCPRFEELSVDLTRDEQWVGLKALIRHQKQQLTRYSHMMLFELLLGLRVYFTSHPLSRLVYKVIGSSTICYYRLMRTFLPIQTRSGRIDHIRCSY